MLSSLQNITTDTENIQRALLNILDDYSMEKLNMENTQRAVLNILDDYGAEKYHLENTQRALLNILDDFASEKSNMENTQRAVLNILDDYNAEKSNMENTQRALLNILDDYSAEKLNMENTQRALLNILDDYRYERSVSDDLKIANKELEQFSYVASHDLQEPLRTITNFVGLLYKKHAGSADEEIKTYFNFILTATDRMRTLIRDLLDFSRVGRSVTFEEVNCNILLKEVITELDASIKENNAKIIFPILPTMKGNKISLKQLFQNLLSNSIKFRKKNVNPVIYVAFEEKDTEYLFSIKDNGIGIEEQFKNNLFVIFQRLHTASEYPGTGIGLAICKKIVELHGGKIWIESKFGEGCTFYFTISKILKEI